MTRYACWFSIIQANTCNKYLESNDCGTDQKCSQVINWFSKDITDITQAKQERLPDDLEKVGEISSSCSEPSLMFPVSASGLGTM